MRSGTLASSDGSIPAQVFAVGVQHHPHRTGSSGSGLLKALRIAEPHQRVERVGVRDGRLAIRATPFRATARSDRSSGMSMARALLRIDCRMIRSPLMRAPAPGPSSLNLRATTTQSQPSATTTQFLPRRLPRYGQSALDQAVGAVPMAWQVPTLTEGLKGAAIREPVRHRRGEACADALRPRGGLERDSGNSTMNLIRHADRRCRCRHQAVADHAAARRWSTRSPSRWP